ASSRGAWTFGTVDERSLKHLGSIAQWIQSTGRLRAWPLPKEAIGHRAWMGVALLNCWPRALRRPLQYPHHAMAGHAEVARSDEDAGRSVPRRETHEQIDLRSGARPPPEDDLGAWLKMVTEHLTPPERAARTE